MVSFDELQEIFGEARLESSGNRSVGGEPRRFVFHVHAVDSSHLAIHVTDFRSDTWESIRSLLHMEDLMDDTGVGGSFSEFMEYFISSFKSQDVKLVCQGDLTSDTGTGWVRLVAQKRKGMPVISISLEKLTDSAAMEATANLSLQLFQAYKNTNELRLKDRDGSARLMSERSDEQENIESITSQSEQYSKRKKLQGAKISKDADAHTVPNNGLQSPEKQAPRESASTKVASRVVPAYRRARVRGALLQDTEDTEDKKQ